MWSTAASPLCCPNQGPNIQPGMHNKRELRIGLSLVCFSLISAALAHSLHATNASAISSWGSYRYVYKFWFKLYDVELRAASAAQPESILNASSEFQLAFRYHRQIDRAIILKSADKILRRNLSAQHMAQIAERVSHIHAAYRSVDAGDCSSLHYRPTSGTTLSINGQDLITIPGADFAQHYFKIWLGPEPISAALKTALLTSPQQQPPQQPPQQQQQQQP